jgi:hypothetical protein
LIKAQPDLKTSELARTLEGAKATVTNRLDKPQKRGLIERDESGWSSTSIPT